MKKLFHYLISATILLFIFTQCSKEATEDFGDIEKNLVQDNQIAENTVNDVLNITEQAGKWGNTYYKSSNLLSTCATVTHDTLSNPKVLTIDFGTTNCLCSDGKNRRGKIIASYSGSYNTEGTIIFITFDNYFANNYQILGSKVITNMGQNNTLDPWFQVEVDIQVIHPTSGDTLNYIAERSRTWIEGDNSLSLLDDVYLIEGTATGTNTNGNQFVTTILQGLRKEVGCPQFVSGEIKIDRTNKPSIWVDFGTGDCDGSCTITINSTIYTYGL
jgi:hypothetical protein